MKEAQLLVVGPNYSEGTYLDLSIEVGDNEITAYVSTTNGSKTTTFSKDDNSIDSKWFTDEVENNDILLYQGFYFKAGVYNDSGNGSDHPKGEFTSFNYDN